MADLLEKVMPHALEAEQSVLGSMLIDNRCVSDVVCILQPADFYVKQNAEIYETIYSMFNFSEPIDPVTVLNKLKERGLADDRTGDYLAQLIDVTPTAAYAVQYANIVHEKAMMRALAQAADEISATVAEGVGTPDEVLDVAEKKIYAIRKGNTGDTLQKIGTVLVDVYTRLVELASSGQAFPGLPTGLHDLDKMLGGLNKSDFVVLAARPGVGKTSLALNIALNIAKKVEKTVAIFSLEMSREQMAVRLLSGEGFVDNNKLTTGRLSDEDWRRVSIATGVLNKLDIRIDDNPAATVASINAKCRRLDNLGLGIIDYLQLMADSGYGTRRGDNRVTVVGEISRSLKVMAKELNVPVLCLSQLSRDLEKRKENKVPMLSDLRESGSIEQDADSVLFIHRPNEEEPNAFELIVAKNRHGETGKVEVQWVPQFTTFCDREKRHEG